MLIANDGQNYLAKFIKEFKSKARLQCNSNLRKVKEDVLNSAMALLKGREIVFKALKCGIFSRLEQPEKSEQSSNDVKYSSVGRDLYELSKKLQDGLLKLDGISNDSDIQSFTPIKKRNRT